MRSHVLVTLIFISCAVSTVLAGGTFGGFAAGPGWDTIEVQMSTSCCLPLDAVYSLRFDRKPRLHVAVSEEAHGDFREGAFVVVTNRIALGVLQLTETDLAGLDKLMAFYHSKHETVCSVEDRVKIVATREGREVGTEELVDSACSMLETNYLTFHGIVKRLRSHERGVQPDGAANGGEPIRSETNRTSSAAGSRR